MLIIMVIAAFFNRGDVVVTAFAMQSVDVGSTLRSIHTKDFQNSIDSFPAWLSVVKVMWRKKQN